MSSTVTCTATTTVNDANEVFLTSFRKPVSKQESPSSQKTQRTRLFDEEINVLYDSKCNICVWEMEWLCQRDARINHPRRKIKLTDIESPDYNPYDPANGGVSYLQAIKSMHAVTAHGQVIEGMPVFRLAYGYAGVGWMLILTGWPIFKIFFDAFYCVFAKYRTVVTRGTTFDELMELHQRKCQQEQCRHARTGGSCTTITTTRSNAATRGWAKKEQ